MSTPEQTIVAGVTTTAGSFLTAVVAQAIPILQALSLIVGITVGILTAVYTYRRIKALPPRGGSGGPTS